MVDLLLQWDTPPRDGESPRKRPKTESYTMPAHLRDMTLRFLARFVSLSLEPIATNEVTKHAFELLEKMHTLPAWQDVQVRLALLQRALIHTDVTEQHHGPIANALATLDVVTRGRDEAWLQAHAAQLHKLLEKTLASDQTELLDAARPVLMRLCSILPPTEDESAQNEDVRAFSTAAETAISEGLKNGTGLASALALLDAWSHTHPGVIDRHQLPLIKTLTRLAKEHLSGHGGDAVLTHLLRVLTLLRSRISHLGDQRRWFLSAVVQLVEKSPSDKVCAFLLEMMRTCLLYTSDAADE